MIQNNIRWKLEQSGITQTDAISKMPSYVGKVGMSFITTGKVLPTKDSLQALCDILDCCPSELYNPGDLDLLSLNTGNEKNDIAVITPSSKKDSSGHGDMNQLRVWLKPYEREAIEKAVTELGYRSISEWLREMIRNTVARNMRLHAKQV